MDNLLLQALIEVILELLLSTAIRQRPRNLKDKFDSIKSIRLGKASVRRAEFVNRTNTIRAIEAALSETVSTRVLYFYGPGGIGKTRLFEEARLRIQGMPRKQRVHWGGLHDLNNVDFHNIMLLQSAIIHELDPEGALFSDYYVAWNKYEQVCAQGGTGVHKAQQHIEQLFFESLRSFAADHRIVLAFDTIETLIHESRLVQFICAIKSEPTAIREWLLQKLLSTPNAVILLAGRPDSDFKEDLEEVGLDRPGLVESRLITGLTRKDSNVLLEKLRGNDLVELENFMEQSDLIWKATRGSPVLLTLTMELLRQADAGIQLHPGVQAGELARNLVEILFDYNDPDSRTLFFLAIARKGLDSGLLHYLEPAWTREECIDRIEKARSLGIVKTCTDNDEICLHDALYELFEEFSPPQHQLLPWYERIAEYYRGLAIRSMGERVVNSQLLPRLLFYELYVNPRQAFENHYMYWDEVAIRGLDNGLDMQLRNELLRFVQSRRFQDIVHSIDSRLKPDIERDSILRWVKRYLSQTNYEQAIKVSETILALDRHSKVKIQQRPVIARTLPQRERAQANQLFDGATDFFWGQLLSLYGEALTYAGNLNTTTESLLEDASELLAQELDSNLFWLRNRSLGRVYDRLGYLARSKGSLGKALQFYRMALTHYEKAKVEDEQANTLNNLSFVQANLGLIDEAQKTVERAFVLRQELSQQYPLALSQNTRGLIRVLAGQFHSGVRDCRTALSIFEDIRTSRGIGLASNALGWAYRQHGNALCAHAYQEGGDTAYETAIHFLKKAVHIFSDEVDEPIRLWEAYNELSCVYRDRSIAVRKFAKSRAEQDFAEASTYLEMASEVAQVDQLLFQLLDTYDDLTQLAVNHSDFAMAREWLSKTNILIQSSFPNDRISGNYVQGDAVWLILGKYHWQEAIWHKLQLDDSSLSVSANVGDQNIHLTAKHAAKAIVFFQKYWPNTRMVRVKYDKSLSLFPQSDSDTEILRKNLNEVAAMYACDLSFLMNS